MVTYHNHMFRDTDINECTPTKHNECHAIAKCKNTDGSYKCVCPKRYFGDGTKEGGCQLRQAGYHVLSIVLGKQLSFFFKNIFFVLIKYINFSF